MRCVPLFSRRFQIEPQYLLDLIFDRAEFRLFSFWDFRAGGTAALIAWRTIRR